MSSTPHYDSPRSYSPPTFRSSSTRPLPTASAPPSESAPISARIPTLLETLNTAKSILEQECVRSDKFSHLALALLDKDLTGLATTCELIRSSSTTARPEVVRSDSRPRLPRIATSDEALQDAVKANLPVVIPDPTPPPPAPPSRPASVAGHRQHPPSHSSRHRDQPRYDYSSDASFRREKEKEKKPSRRPQPQSPTIQPQQAEPLSPPPRQKSRASSRRSPSRDPISKADYSSTTHRRDVSPPPPAAPAPIIVEERRKPPSSSSSAVSSRHYKPDLLSGTSDSDASYVEPPPVVRSRSRAKSVSAASRSSAAGRPKSRAAEEARRSIPEPSAPPPEIEREPVVLKGERVWRGIAEALMSDGTGATVGRMALVSREVKEAVHPELYGSVVVNSLKMATTLDRSLVSNPSLANLVQRLQLDPLPSSSVPDLLPPLRSLLSHLDSLQFLTEDLTSSDWDVTALNSDYILPLSSSSPLQLTSLTSTRCWWELTALTSLLALLQPTLSSLTLLGAAMDRDWAGSALLSKPSLSPPSRLRSLVINQIMHEDTLAVLLRETPELRRLEVGFQVIGPTDDDTPRKSIPLAFRHVGSTLTHLSIRAPSKEGEDTTGLLDEIVAQLPRLEVLEFEETSLPSGVRIPLASPHFLLSLPSTLHTLRGRNIVSFGSSRVLDMLEEVEKVPRLGEIDLRWSVGEGEKGETWKERHRGRIEEGCREVGINCLVGRGVGELRFGLGSRE
ncbi:hypothetical protein BCR35DRAFT_353434 [Leucosporidium creatinivorum]|uniref:Proteophosphoglycan ppg4 n=1 Tax=Leucosporidium creatinivorum TaxID=106004 RepID=A0A1Y2EXQ8_9BASI|nr:hypothetical protein BCR35DRAFT_353434 [Leucosporidium creatinivorum]